MHNLFTLKIISPDKTLLNEEVQSVNIPTKSGVITVLKDHQPLISVLTAGEIKVLTKEKQEEKFLISGGILDVKKENSEVVILADELLNEESITKETLEIEIERAKEAMKIRKEDEDYSILEGEMEKNLFLLRRKKNR